MDKLQWHVLKKYMMGQLKVTLKQMQYVTCDTVFRRRYIQRQGQQQQK